MGETGGDGAVEGEELGEEVGFGGEAVGGEDGGIEGGVGGFERVRTGEFGLWQRGCICGNGVSF